MILPRYSSCVLDHRYFLGTFQDFSKYGNHGVPTGCNFERNPDTHIAFSGTDLITVSDSAELQFTAGTVILYTDEGFRISSGIDYIISNRGVGGSTWEFRTQSSSSISVRDGVNTRSITINEDESLKFYAVTIEDGLVPRLYVNGSLFGEFNGTVSITAANQDLIIGNIYSGGSTLDYGLKGVLLYNVVLTDEEIAKVFEWTTQTRTSYYPKRNFVFDSFSTGREASATGIYDLKSTTGKVLDKTGNGNDGTIISPVSFIDGLGGLDGAFFRLSQKGFINFGSNTFDATSVTFSMLFRHHNNNSGWLFNKFIGTSEAWGVYNPSGSIRMFDDIDNGNASLYTTDTNAMQWYHLVIQLDDTTNRMWLDGVLIGEDQISSANIESFTAGYTLGARGANGQNPYDGDIADFRAYNVALTTAQVQALYDRYAKIPLFSDDLKDANISVAAEGAAVGEYLSNTNWRFGSTAARYKISERTGGTLGERQIECTVAGFLYQEMTQAYGTFKCKVYKDLDANVLDVMLVADTIGGGGATGQDGYGIRFDSDETIAIIESTNGTPSDKVTSTAKSLQTWYEVKVTRRYDGLFELFIDGVSIGTATDNTTTSSKFLVLDMDAGDLVTEFVFYHGVI